MSCLIESEYIGGEGGGGGGGGISMAIHFFKGCLTFWEIYTVVIVLLILRGIVWTSMHKIMSDYFCFLKIPENSWRIWWNYCVLSSLQKWSSKWLRVRSHNGRSYAVHEKVSFSLFSYLLPWFRQSSQNNLGTSNKSRQVFIQVFFILLKKKTETILCGLNVQ